MWYFGTYAEGSVWVSKPVGGKLPNNFGLYDMHGNVEEWCEDLWHDDYTGAPTDGSAWILNPPDWSEEDRVYRGGHWSSEARYCRSASRRNGDPSYRYDYIGFRLASLR